jgi:hypothetical protein
MKIRNLLTDPVKNETCLDDLVRELIDCGVPLGKLEHKNTGDALKASKKALAEFKRKLIEFELRIKTTITNEVLEEISKRDKSVKIGNPEKLLEYRLSKKNNELL